MQGSSETSNWNLDVLQTLVRAALKIGGGFMLAKGLADESTLESLTAGAVALAAIIWGVRHRTSRGSTSPGSLPSTPLFLLAFLVWGCASLTTRDFRDSRPQNFIVNQLSRAVPASTRTFLIACQMCPIQIGK